MHGTDPKQHSKVLRMELRFKPLTRSQTNLLEVYMLNRPEAALTKFKN